MSATRAFFPRMVITNIDLVSGHSNESMQVGLFTGGEEEEEEEEEAVGSCCKLRLRPNHEVSIQSKRGGRRRKRR